MSPRYRSATLPSLQSLPPACFVEGTETAQRFLGRAFDSVEASLNTLDTLRAVRRDRGENVTGRLTSQEEDLLRAAIVFTGAGLDATLNDSSATRSRAF